MSDTITLLKAIQSNLATSGSTFVKVEMDSFTQCQHSVVESFEAMKYPFYSIVYRICSASKSTYDQISKFLTSQNLTELLTPLSFDLDVGYFITPPIPKHKRTVGLVDFYSDKGDFSLIRLSLASIPPSNIQDYHVLNIMINWETHKHSPFIEGVDRLTQVVEMKKLSRKLSKPKGEYLIIGTGGVIEKSPNAGGFFNDKYKVWSWDAKILNDFIETILHIQKGRFRDLHSVSPTTYYKCAYQKPEYRIGSDDKWLFDRFISHLDNVIDKDEKPSSRDTLTKNLRHKVWEQFNGRLLDGKCFSCDGKITFENFHAGHIISKKEGGKKTLDNLRPLCQSCNCSMGSEHMFEYIRRNQFAGVKNLPSNNPSKPETPVLNPQTAAMMETMKGILSHIPSLDNMIRKGQKIEEESPIFSPNKESKLILQKDGNLVLYGKERVLWASNTDNKGHAPRHLIFQTDGNVVIYDKLNKPLWATNTCGKDSEKMVVDDDRVKLLSSSNQVLWAS